MLCPSCSFAPSRNKTGYYFHVRKRTKKWPKSEPTAEKGMRCSNPIHPGRLVCSRPSLSSNSGILFCSLPKSKSLLKSDSCLRAKYEIEKDARGSLTVHVMHVKQATRAWRWSRGAGLGCRKSAMGPPPCCANCPSAAHKSQSCVNFPALQQQFHHHQCRVRAQSTIGIECSSRSGAQCIAGIAARAKPFCREE